MFKIILVHPRIPQNTGSIGRMCFNAGLELHLINPLFSLDERRLRRAGLDYWARLAPRLWEDIPSFLAAQEPDFSRYFFATTRASKNYFEVAFRPGDLLFFGSESQGLPEELMDLAPQNKIKIPLLPKGRSLNLATATGIIAYEALRQNFAAWVGENF